MVNNILKLGEYNHPNKESKAIFDSLISIDKHKSELVKNLSLLLDSERTIAWRDQYHKEGLNLFNFVQGNTPLIILSGEVGCGKTALAQSVGTPLAEKMGKRVLTLETPSNLRGSGMVGEISNRITEAFNIAKSKISDDKVGILIIDEADDIATSRSQNQAHHEDRAGLNVLIKQIDLLKREGTSLAVILITNRLDTLDPAVRRRVSLQLNFERPRNGKLKPVFEYILQGTDFSQEHVDRLVSLASTRAIPYSFSDIIQRAGKQALFQAIEDNKPFTPDIYFETLKNIEPTPLIENGELT